jgi:hypothetical protein
MSHYFGEPVPSQRLLRAVRQSELVRNFRNAAARLGDEDYAPTFSAAAERLAHHFELAYGDAENAATKKTLITDFTDFVIEVANRHPQDSESATAQADAVQLFCTTLAQDKSLIPADFYTRLMSANHELLGCTGGEGEGYNTAVAEATKTIAEAAFQLHPTHPTPVTQQFKTRP